MRSSVAGPPTPAATPAPEAPRRPAGSSRSSSRIEGQRLELQQPVDDLRQLGVVRGDQLVRDRRQRLAQGYGAGVVQRDGFRKRHLQQEVPWAMAELRGGDVR